MTPPARPLGFTLIALCLGFMAVAGLANLMSGGAEHGMAALPLVIAVFAAVAAEALWNCRKWCVRAFVAFCCVRLLQPLTWAIGEGAMDGTTVFVSFVVLAFIAAIAGGYVHNRATRMFASPQHRIPIPAPRP